MRVDYPGIGGSLGECVICGNSFALEVMLGKNVATAKLEGFAKELPMHQKCLDSIPDGSSWEALPEGPLRREYAEHFNPGPQLDPSASDAKAHESTNPLESTT